MSKLIIYNIFFIFFISFGGCSSGQYHSNVLELKGEVSRVKLINYQIEKDSAGIFFNDTSYVNLFFLNKNGNLHSSLYYFFIENKIVHSIFCRYHYNSKNQLAVEHCKVIEDSLSFDVKYTYKDSLLQNTFGSINMDGLTTSQIEEYFYRSNGLLKERILSEIEIDNKNDTTYVSKVFSDMI